MTTITTTTHCPGSGALVGQGEDWREIPAVECPGCRQQVGTSVDDERYLVVRDHDARRNYSSTLQPILTDEERFMA